MTWKRVATALVLIPVVVGLVLFASTAVVAIATAVVTVMALWEYFALGEAIGHRAYRVWAIVCSLLFIYSQWLASYDSRFSDRIYFLFGRPLGERPSVEWYLFLFVFGLTMFILWTKRPLVEALPAAGITCSALLLVAFPLSFAVTLHGLPRIGPRLLLFALVITWAGDTAAYFVGRAMGKHPLAPHISPKKTWEGSVGSMVGSLVVAWAFHYCNLIPIGHLVAMTVIGNVAGQMGDLLESAYKRSAGVKDSGGLLPGHGGVLDRIDALILCIPVIWYYLVLVNPGTN
ncbi:MAG TPA: phosphatidate cytidylyltransferase [Candidatus Limnocylindrales bacterium]|nr:phosphatidate cytidylyltransferase [Candidatus Limnocylindrales bacterium]